MRLSVEKVLERALQDFDDVAAVLVAKGLAPEAAPLVAAQLVLAARLETLEDTLVDQLPSAGGGS
jgi:hypothetical protein